MSKSSQRRMRNRTKRLGAMSAASRGSWLRSRTLGWAAEIRWRVGEIGAESAVSLLTEIEESLAPLAADPAIAECISDLRNVLERAVAEKWIGGRLISDYRAIAEHQLHEIREHRFRVVRPMRERAVEPARRRTTR